MSKFASKRAREFYAQTYEATVGDWPGEIDFYRALAAETFANDQAVLEVACGTGRVVHLDQPEIDWLGALTGDQGGVFETTEPFVHPQTGRPVRTLQAWWYEPATQTAISHKVWEILGPEGQVVERLDRGPIRLHVVFRFEMEHLLARAGFRLEAVYGDFWRGALRDESSEMIWVARKGQV
jgi:hypothetical protein